MKKIVVWVTLILVLLPFGKNAHAYLDPGSGSMLLQLLLGGIAGLVVVIKLYWRRFLSLLGIKRDKKEEDTSGPSV